VHPDDLDDCLARCSSSFDARRNYRLEFRLRRADGDYRSVSYNGVPRFAATGVFLGYIGSCIDITDAKRAQEKALVRQKLESMGLMASGIAHDFNNLLGSMLASAELLLTERDDGLLCEEELQRIKAAAVRGAELVRELMIYAGHEDPAFENVDIAALVKEMLHLLQVAIPKRLTLKIDLATDLPAVRASSTQLRQVVMNLISNASDAMGDRPGEIHVSTQVVKVGGTAGPADPPEGDYLRLQVSDTGCGMTRQVQARIFDPFFSTKDSGRGLGLAVVQGIIRTHKGAIRVASEPGKGTTFEVLLPCAAKSVREHATSVAHFEEEARVRVRAV
jgi:signal transduction histidine kinase